MTWLKLIGFLIELYRELKRLEHESKINSIDDDPVEYFNGLRDDSASDASGSETKRGVQ